MKTVDRPEGFREKQAEITVQRLHRIADMQSMVMAEAAPIASGSSSGQSRPATTASSSASQPTSTPDYDEIPF